MIRWREYYYAVICGAWLFSVTMSLMLAQNAVVDGRPGWLAVWVFTSVGGVMGTIDAVDRGSLWREFYTWRNTLPTSGK